MEREIASVGGIGGFKELLTFLKVEEEEEPCWARETKFTLSCSFKTTAGQGERIDALQFGHGARTEECRACKEKALLCLRRKTAQGHIAHGWEHYPSLKDTGDHDKNSSIIFFFFSMVL